MPIEMEELQDRNAWKIRAIDGLKFVSLTAKMIGDFFREIAALVFIFVPLELWDKQQMPAHSSLIEYAILGTLLTLSIGFAFEYLSVLANRFKKDMEGNSGK